MNGGALLLAHHRDELERGSGITAGVIAARGYRSVTAAEAAALGFAPSQCRAGLFLPTHTLAGVQLLGMLKPNEPRMDRDGRTLKYEWPAGHPPLLDCHPDALAALRTPGTAKWFTEGHKKADAAWSHGLPCVNVPGVWAFLRGRLVVPDLDEIRLDGETCYVVFDSDVTRKRAVEQALLRFCAALHRRGARVFVVYLPEGPDGEKAGLDDYVVAGGTVEELRSLARPWDGSGPGVFMHLAGEEEPGALRATITALVQAIINPELGRADLQLMAAVAAQSAAKLARGEVEADGTVILTTAEISDDWRPAPPAGERVASHNPAGTRPRMARERVGRLMQAAVARGLLDAEPRRTVRQHGSGTMYNATDWAVRPAKTFGAMIAAWAGYQPDVPMARKPRSQSEPCPECGEVHPAERIAYCRGCGATRRKSASTRASDNLSEAEPDGEPSTTSPTPYLLSDDISEAPDRAETGDPWQPLLDRFIVPDSGDPDRWLYR